MLTDKTKMFAISALIWAGIETPAWAADLVVSAGQGTMQPTQAVSVRVGLPTFQSAHGAVSAKLPANSTNASAFYQACSANDAKSKPGTGLGWEAFCSLKDQQTLITQVTAEGVPELMAGGVHTFAKKLALPAHLPGPTLWVLVRVDYHTPDQKAGMHHSLYGSAAVLYRCTGSGGISRRRSCAYYTPAAWTALQQGSTLPLPKPPGT